jgi:shikimate dehydrogenase
MDEAGMTANPDKYAVAGFPVKHSWSPFIHGLFAKQTGQNMVYRLLEIPPEHFRADVLAFFADGGKGLNVTLPFKQSAAQLVNKLSPRAEQAGAVNTIIRRENELIGDNTDGVGLVTDLDQNLGLPLKGKRVLMLGAGGASRGVIGPLLAAGVAGIHIANRSAPRAEELVEIFKPLGAVTCSAFDAVVGEFDLVVNATSASMNGEVPPVPPTVIGERTVCYDMSYGSGDTAFTMWAKGYGASLAITGWGMLVEQAAEAFFLWRGVRPQTRPVLDAIKKPMPGKKG